jgi:hypothetical protein
VIDVEPLIISGLDRLVPLPSGERADWQEVLGQAGVRSRSRLSRKRLVVAVACLAAVSAIVVAPPVRAALGHGFNTFSTWLTGSPGKPSSPSEQRAFDRATRSWAGFPQGTKLRRLVQTRTGGATFALYGFRGAGSLCLRLVVTGSVSTHTLACPPLSALRGSDQPGLVVAANEGVGVIRASNGLHAFFTSKFAVTFGVVADGVQRIELGGSDGTSATALVSGDTFLAIRKGSSPVTHAWAIAGNQRRALALTAIVASGPSGFLQATGPQLTIKGPAAVQRIVHGGAIRWLARREPRGMAVPGTVHHIVGVLPDVIFRREITPDPSAPERVVVSVRPAGAAYSGAHLRNKLQVCAEVVGGRFVGGGGCWPAGRLFSTAPFSLGVLEQPGGQTVTIAGLASDDVAKLTLYLGTGRRVDVPLHDNGYITSAARADYPVRLVAYDSEGRVIGIKTLQESSHTNRAVPQRVVNAHGQWRSLFRTSAGEVFVASATGGGICYAIRVGVVTSGPTCESPPAANELQLAVGWSKQGAEVTGRVGSAVSRVLVHLADGKTQTISPIRGYILAVLPPGTVARNGNPVRSITALSANGRTINQPGSNLTGGSGTITRLSPTSVAIGSTKATHSCRVTSESPSLDGYSVGTHVQYLCQHGALSLIGRSIPSKSAIWASRTIWAKGPITALTPTTISLRNTLAQAGTSAATVTCALTEDSPKTANFHLAERIQVFCSHGRLTGINREFP